MHGILVIYEFVDKIKETKTALIRRILISYSALYVFRIVSAYNCYSHSYRHGPCAHSDVFGLNIRHTFIACLL